MRQICMILIVLVFSFALVPAADARKWRKYGGQMMGGHQQEFRHMGRFSGQRFQGGSYRRFNQYSGNGGWRSRPFRGQNDGGYRRSDSYAGSGSQGREPRTLSGNGERIREGDYCQYAYTYSDGNYYCGN